MNIHTYTFNLVETLVNLKNNYPIRFAIPKASIRIEPRDDSIIDSWQIPKFKRFSHIEMDRNQSQSFLDDAITKLDPFHHDGDDFSLKLGCQNYQITNSFLLLDSIQKSPVMYLLVSIQSQDCRQLFSNFLIIRFRKLKNGTFPFIGNVYSR